MAFGDGDFGCDHLPGLFFLGGARWWLFLARRCFAGDDGCWPMVTWCDGPEQCRDQHAAGDGQAQVQEMIRRVQPQPGVLRVPVLAAVAITNTKV